MRGTIVVILLLGLIFGFLPAGVLAGDVCEESVERMIQCTDDPAKKAELEENREGVVIRCKMDAAMKALVEKCAGIADCEEYMACVTGQ